MRDNAVEMDLRKPRPWYFEVANRLVICAGFHCALLTGNWAARLSLPEPEPAIYREVAERAAI